MEVSIMSPVVHNKANPRKRNPVIEPAVEPTVVICGEDGQELVGVCDGPDEGGQCPWADVEGRLPCNGNWIVAGGWTLKVAEDARGCPIAMLGISPPDTA
jgi:hypothetical protein